MPSEARCFTMFGPIAGAALLLRAARVCMQSITAYVHEWLQQFCVASPRCQCFGCAAHCQTSQSLNRGGAGMLFSLSCILSSFFSSAPKAYLDQGRPGSRDPEASRDVCRACVRACVSSVAGVGGYRGVGGGGPSLAARGGAEVGVPDRAQPPAQPA